MSPRAAVLAAIALGAARQLSSAAWVDPGGGAPAADQACEDAVACAAAAGGGDLDEVTSMLMIQRLRREGKMRHGGKDVKCPGADHWCAGNQCCGRIPWTGHRTFPCPTADPGFVGCEANSEEEILRGLLQSLTRADKYKFVRGVGWDNGTYATKPGYYVGDSGINAEHGIPPLLMQDNGQGFRTVDFRMIDEVTGWPSTLAVASTWSEGMTEKWGEALGREFRAKGANVLLGPGVNVQRVALNGRNAEYASGESPYLGARLAPPYVRGVQSQGVLAVAKHFALNQQELNRDTVDCITDERTLWEMYYPPYEAAVNAGVAAFMCSYNLVNGVHACGNRELLVRDLKGKMGFEGFVMSDWWALHSFAAEDGVDQEMPGDSSPSSPAYYTDANLDTLSDAKIDDMVRRQLLMISRFGLWKEKIECQPPECEYYLYAANASSPEHKELALELATQAVTLLQNRNDVLPLKKDSTIALVGFACFAPQDYWKQLEDWQAGSYYNIGGSGRVIASDPVTVYGGLRAKCEAHGCTIKTYRGSDAAEAEAFIRDWKPDVVLMCGGTTATEGRDRTSLSVDQEAFLVDLAQKMATPAHSAPVVSITMVPAQTVMPWARLVHAAVTSMLAGTYTGTAFAEVLFGDWNPSGKLPVTFPESVDDTILPCKQDFCPYTEGLHTGYYWYLDKNVTFPFGHGLSYTSFDYEEMNIWPVDTEDGVQWVEVTLRNSGRVKGVEVAQLYLTYPIHQTEEPKGQLRGFVRKELLPGQREVFRFPLRARDFQIYNMTEGAFVNVLGKFTIAVGSSSRDLRLSEPLWK